MPAKKKMSQKVDKRYRRSVTIDGHPIYVSGKTKKEVDRKAEQLKRRYRDGYKSDDIPFVQLVRLWWNNYKEPTIKSASTRAGYMSIMRAHILPFFQPYHMSRAVTLQDLQACVNQATGKSAQIGKRILAVLRGAYSYGIIEGYLSIDISRYVTKPVHSVTKEKAALTEKQTQKLLAIAQTQKYGIIIMLLYYLGLRRGQAVGLQWQDIDWEQKAVHIQRSITFAKTDQKITPGKTKAANRWVPMPNILLDYLRPLRGLPSSWVITKQDGELMDSCTFYYYWNDMMYKAGLAKLKQQDARGNEIKRHRLKYDVIPQITPHALRHNYVTMLYDAGVDAITATKIVGHSSYRVTADIYTHISQTRKTHTMEAINDVFSNKSCQNLARRTL